MWGDHRTNVLVNVLRPKAAQQQGHTLAEPEPEQLLSRKRACLQLLNADRQHALFGAVSNDQFRLLIPLSWRILPDDVVEVVQVLREIDRWGELSGTRYRVQTVQDSQFGRIGFVQRNALDAR
jgi:hypothetical protein